jgi:Tfp pilus assembly protein PilW
MEVMVATVASTIVATAIFTTFSMVTKGFSSTGNYADLARDGRITLDYFARDVRQATGLVSFAATDITMAIPTNFTSSGSVSGTKSVRYYLGSTSKSNILYRVDLGKTTTVENVSALQFVPYNTSFSTSGVTAATCKLLQMNLTMRKTTIATTNSQSSVSVRALLRNKP